MSNYGTITPSRNIPPASNIPNNPGTDPSTNDTSMRPCGLTVFTAAIFVAGEMAGSGVLALPKAIVDTGWVGFILLIIFCLNAGYSGSRLGDCWTIIEERHPEYRTSTRNPYPTLAFVIMGKWGSLLVSACVQLTLFGVGTVYLLLASSLIENLLERWISIRSCWMILVFAAILCIPMWLGTPKDFRLVGFGALLATILSCFCIFMQILIDGLSADIPSTHETYSLNKFFCAIGVILFAFGGASTFPTIQNDMIDRNNFNKSVRIAFTIILIIYLPITTAAYYVYGGTLKPNLIDVLRPSLFTDSAKVFMSVHLILAFLIIVNPVSQELEEKFRIPKEFCPKRCILRTVILSFMVLTGETIPKFSHILALVGGSTVTLSTFVLPPYLYMKICDESDDTRIALHERTYLWELIIVGIIGGVASSFSAVQTILTDPFSKPCYWPTP